MCSYACIYCKLISHRHGLCHCGTDQIGNLTVPVPYRPPVLCITANRACYKTRLGPLGELQLLNLSRKHSSSL